MAPDFSGRGGAGTPICIFNSEGESERCASSVAFLSMFSLWAITA